MKSAYALFTYEELAELGRLLSHRAMAQPDRSAAYRDLNDLRDIVAEMLNRGIGPQTFSLKQFDDHQRELFDRVDQKFREASA